MSVQDHRAAKVRNLQALLGLALGLPPVSLSCLPDPTAACEGGWGSKARSRVPSQGAGELEFKASYCLGLLQSQSVAGTLLLPLRAVWVPHKEGIPG